jgi:hypothetical protein
MNKQKFEAKSRIDGSCSKLSKDHEILCQTEDHFVAWMQTLTVAVGSMPVPTT